MVAGEEVVERRRSHKCSFGHCIGHKVSDIDKAEFAIDKALHSHLIGGIHHTRYVAALPNSFVSQRQTTEFGIEPDYTVNQTDEDFSRGRDTLIEFARKLLVE